MEYCSCCTKFLNRVYKYPWGFFSSLYNECKGKEQQRGLNYYTSSCFNFFLSAPFLCKRRNYSLDVFKICFYMQREEHMKLEAKTFRLEVNIYQKCRGAQGKDVRYDSIGCPEDWISCRFHRLCFPK